jgi:hypothetical protein
MHYVRLFLSRPSDLFQLDRPSRTPGEPIRSMRRGKRAAAQNLFPPSAAPTHSLPMALRSSSLRPVILLIVVWLVARSFPIAVYDPLRSWDTWQCEKLLDYGFFERGGAQLKTPYASGLLPEPERFNYVNHPFPIFWVNTLLYATGGYLLLQVAHLVLKLIGFLLLFWVLDRLFSRTSAVLTCVLFAIAPLPMLWDMDPNPIPVAALIWPAGLGLIVAAREKAWVRERLPWLLGAAIFIFGQCDWLALTTVPALLAAIKTPGTRWTPLALWHELRRNAAWRGLLAGAAATALLFTAQVLLACPDLASAMSYAVSQTGATGALPKWKLGLLVAARLVLWVGLPLCLLGLAGLWAMRRRQIDPVLTAAPVYFVTFVLTGVVLTKFFYSESSPYDFLEHSFTLAAAWAFDTLPRRRVLAYAAFALALPHLAYAWMAAAVPAASRSVRTLASAIGAVTEPREIVFTNLAVQQPPLPAWEPGAWLPLARISNRYILFDAVAPEQWPEKTLLFPGAPRVFLRVREKPSPAGLEQVLASLPTRATREVTLPPDPRTIPQKMRGVLWRISGKFEDKLGNFEASERRVTLDVYVLPPGTPAAEGGAAKQ